MKKEIIIAGVLGLATGLLLMHVAMNKKKGATSGADGDFVTDRSKKVWDNMLDVTGTPIDPKGGQANGRVSNMLDADASEVSNMLDVAGVDPKKGLNYPRGYNNMLDVTGRRFPRQERQWPNPKTGSGWA